MSTIHMVPVPEDRLQEVYSVLGRPKANGASPAPDAGDAGPTIDVGLIARAYRESPPRMVAFLDYLADRPDEKISSNELAKHMGVTWNGLAGVLGAFGRRWKNRYQQKGHWFFGAHWNYEEGHQDYTMPAAAADIIKEARSGS